MTAVTAPAALPVLPDAIPEELRLLDQWVAWRWEWRGDKWTKVPLSPATGRRASSTDRDTWDTFAEAWSYARSRRLPGIGFVFSPDDPYAGVDLDKCRDPESGEVADWAREIVALLDSYTEISPSGTGLKVIVRGALPPGRRREGAIEMYDRGRFFTLTGHRYEY